MNLLQLFFDLTETRSEFAFAFSKLLDLENKNQETEKDKADVRAALRKLNMSLDKLHERPQIALYFYSNRFDELSLVDQFLVAACSATNTPEAAEIALKKLNEADQLERRAILIHVTHNASISKNLQHPDILSRLKEILDQEDNISNQENYTSTVKRNITPPISQSRYSLVVVKKARTDSQNPDPIKNDFSHSHS